MAGAGAVFPMAGLPGALTAPNLTPDAETGLGRWSDDEIGRAVREGVDRDGNALFPLMPYERYRRFSDEDLASIVVFLEIARSSAQSATADEDYFSASSSDPQRARTDYLCRSGPGYIHTRKSRRVSR